jgi:phosphatidylglycerol---prolipoprotein diacylglyceryl transferase
MALTYPKIDPVALHLGPVAIRWYGLAYITGLILGWRYTVWLAGQKRFNGPDSRPTANDLDDFLFWAMAGVLIGGRLGIVLFYRPSDYFADPLSILKVWEGGMSFHGGMLGVTAALIWFTQRRKIPLFHVADLVACATPIGLFFGRLANFVNGELWGRVTDSPLGMVFPTGGPLPRHPSQLYEAASEGVLLFVILAVLAQQPAVRQRKGMLTGLFLIGYSIARSTCELFRQPDDYLPNSGFIFGGISMGQILSFPMLLAGLAMVVYALSRPMRPAPSP